MEKLVRVRKVTPLSGYRCLVVFEDDTQREIDLKPYLRGPIFEPILNDITLFRSVRVVDGTVGWDNGADIDPDVLYYAMKPAWMVETTTS
jgi:hypothetical protein